MEKINQIILDLESMGFECLTKHKLYGVWFIGLCTGSLNMRQLHNLSVAFAFEQYSIGKYSALSESELFLRTNISVS